MNFSDYKQLSTEELWELLKKEDRGAWGFVLEKIIDQEKKSKVNNRKRLDWGVPLEELLGQLYDDMVGRRKLWEWKGGSIIGWMRSYIRGYLSRSNPNGNGKFVDIDGGARSEDGEVVLTVGEKYAAQMSEERSRDPYGCEDLQVLRHEQWDVVQKCFRDLWERNSMQAYVMLLKLRFHMSSAEIMERFGMSSAANVDQMFARAVKKMREERVKYVD